MTKNYDEHGISSFGKKHPTCILNIRVICKVRQTQHHNPEFGHTQGEILKKPAKKVH